jgi:hypothetical protein
MPRILSLGRSLRFPLRCELRIAGRPRLGGTDSLRLRSVDRLGQHPEQLGLRLHRFTAFRQGVPFQSRTGERGDFVPSTIR